MARRDRERRLQPPRARGRPHAARRSRSLRAYAKYLRQIGLTFSQSYVEETLAAHPAIAKRLVELFTARFDPRLDGNRALESDGIAAEITEALDGVASLDEDRILRAFLGLVAGDGAHQRLPARRRPAAAARSWRSSSIPALVPDLPLPRPRFEIWVYAPHVEGVHLRGGPVARGGIRWSDRREDFRTEVLGLMKAQMVKNAVIVPTGRQGRVRREAAAGRRSRRRCGPRWCAATATSSAACSTSPTTSATARSCRRPTSCATTATIPTSWSPPTRAPPPSPTSPTTSPRATGTGWATPSPRAAARATTTSRWASPPAARGRACAATSATSASTPTPPRSPSSASATCRATCSATACCCRRHLKLVAAFDHRHVFLDPNPDPAVSWEERKRLFDLPALVVGRLRPHQDLGRRRRLAPRRPRRCRCPTRCGPGSAPPPSRSRPNELISAVLAAPVDLLWNGGIGTYVKASTETNADVGDRTNDAVRIDATDLRATVVGEGGNLGLTQRARVEYALRGGFVNTDAIDNSAGVDTSDHEVNSKILLDGIVAAGDLTEKQRNELLRAGHRRGGRARARRQPGPERGPGPRSRRRRPAMVDVHARYIRALEHDGRLSRRLEALPTDKQLDERQAAGVGLTTPELAVLLSYTKMDQVEEILASDLPDDPYVRPALVGYFPDRYGERFADRMAQPPAAAPDHRHRPRERDGEPGRHHASSSAWRRRRAPLPPDTMRAHLVARDVFDLARQWDAVAELAGRRCRPRCSCGSSSTSASMVERGALWFLRHRRPPLAIGPTRSRRSGPASPPSPTPCPT